MFTDESHPPPRAVGLSGSPSGAAARSGALLDRALRRLADAGFATARVELADLPAAGLLGRASDPAVTQALDAVRSAAVVLAATPIYRGTYSGLLKVFFDLLPEGALAGAVAVPLATGGSHGHQLALDHGVRPLLASLGAVVVSAGVYGADRQFSDGVADAALLERLDRSVAEAVSLARGLRRAEPIPTSERLA